MREPKLTARSATKTYGSAGAFVDAVRAVDLELFAGERVVIMGPSGSGKTTLLLMLAGLLRPTSGTVLLDDEDIFSSDDVDRSATRLRRVGFVFQTFNLLSALTAAQNIQVPMRLAGASRREAASRAGELLERVGVAHRSKHRPRDLSAGEQQRVAIARALANDADMVFADEPTANLDAGNASGVIDLLGGLAEKSSATVVLVGHDMRLLRVADRLLWLQDGAAADPPPWLVAEHASVAVASAGSSQTPGAAG